MKVYRSEILAKAAHLRESGRLIEGDCEYGHNHYDQLVRVNYVTPDEIADICTYLHRAVAACTFGGSTRHITANVFKVHIPID